jgi:hypothetical protein
VEFVSREKSGCKSVFHLKQQIRVEIDERPRSPEIDVCSHREYSHPLKQRNDYHMPPADGPIDDPICMTPQPLQAS